MCSGNSLEIYHLKYMESRDTIPFSEQSYRKGHGIPAIPLERKHVVSGNVKNDMCIQQVFFRIKANLRSNLYTAADTKKTLRDTGHKNI